MLLKSAVSSFKLTILGYEHPDAAGEPYDANWLAIQVDAAGPGGAWTGTDPCLLTYEVVRLSDWLDAVGAGKEPARAISFLEPVLLFRLIEDERGRMLRVHFGNLINPSWKMLDQEMVKSKTSNEKTNPTGQDLFLDFPLAETDLRQAARELREEMRRFPDRAEM
jgi:hypothetical protein